MSYHLIDIVQNLGRPRILVIGDLILDRYVWGDAERISQEAPVILLREDRQEVRLGGAANVAHMLRGLEAEVTMAGVIGSDGEGRLVREELERQGIDCAGVVCDPYRPTTLKQRYLGRAQHRHPHQMLRVDREVRTPISSDLTHEMLDSLLERLDDYQAILISDYAKGVCTREVAHRVIARAKECQIPVIVDPPGSGDCRSYVGATAVTPNRLETKRATGKEIYLGGKRFRRGPNFVCPIGVGICLCHLGQRRHRAHPQRWHERNVSHPQTRGLRHHRRGRHGPGDDRHWSRRRD